MEHNEEQTLLLGREKPSKLLRQYAFPAIVAMIASSAYNIIDSAFIGHGVGAMAIAGITLTFPFMNLAGAFGSLIGVGGATILSIKLGEGDYRSARLVLGNVVILNTIIGLVFSALTLPFLVPILTFFGGTPKTIPYAYDYMKWILLCNVFTHIYFGLNALLRSAGFPKLAMGITIGSVILNIPLAYLFIYPCGWGIEGAAIATCIAQISATLVQAFVFVKRDKIIYFSKDIFRLKKRIVRDCFAIGMSPFLINTAACLVVILLNGAFLHFGEAEHAGGGDYAIGAYGIVNRVSFIFVMVSFGLMQGMQPIVSYNYGSKQYDRMWQTWKLTVKWATVVMSIAFVFCEVFPSHIASVFTNDSEMIAQSARGFRYVMILFPIIGFQMVSTNFFQSTNKPRKSIFLSLTRQVIFLIPMIIILPRLLGLTGVWLALPFSDLLSTIVTYLLIKREIRLMKR
ncbi:MAG: MATE family efflux transporter [Bacteroidales bacterium]|jgi:putative MATE family efflux protein|nr:MATE family efflux transporter [Bacteroidales bacterium]